MFEPDSVMQVYAGADVIGDHVQALAYLWRLTAMGDIDLTVFFSKESDSCLRIFDHVPVSLGIRTQEVLITGERFASGVNDDFARHGVADNCTDNACCIILGPHTISRTQNSSRSRCTSLAGSR